MSQGIRKSRRGCATRDKKSSGKDVGVGRDQKHRNQVEKTWVLDVTEKIEIK